MKRPTVVLCLLAFLGCDQLSTLEENLRPSGGGGTGGSGGGDSCGLSAKQLDDSYVLPLSSPGTAGAFGQACPALHPVQGSGYDTFDPGPETGPCDRHPEVRIQPAHTPCAEPGGSLVYRLVLANRNDPQCPPVSWRFSSNSLSDSVANVRPASNRIVLPGGAQGVVCLEVTSARQQQYEARSRVDFTFEAPGQVRQGAIWHTVRASRPGQ